MAGSAWPNLVAGRKAKAAEVEQKFDWLEGDIVPMLGGAQTDAAYSLGTATARWTSVYTKSLNATSTAGVVVVGTLTACTTTAASDASMEFAGNRAIILPRLSTAQIAALTSVDGMFAYNTSTSQLQVRKSGVWTTIGGTVFQTKAMALTSTISGTTDTALNVAAGGGRLNGIVIYGANANSKPALSVLLDGVQVLSFVSQTNGAFSYYIGAAGDITRGNFGTTTAIGSEVFHPTAAAAPFLGWDFASSCSIYMYSQAGAGTISVQYVYSLIV